MEKVVQILMVLVVALGLVQAKTITMMHKPVPKLSKGEKKFKPWASYGWKSFHLGWQVSYFDLVSFNTLPYDRKEFKLPKGEAYFLTLFNEGKAKKELNKRSTQYLAKAILKSNYFWKYQQPLINDYMFYSLRFIDAKDGRLKAIETLDEVRHFLGKIDTPAELKMWIMASDHPLRASYSYKKIGKLYRVRFFDSDPGECYFHEYFRFYNEKGKVVKKKTIREVHVKGCVEVMM